MLFRNFLRFTTRCLRAVVSGSSMSRPRVNGSASTVFKREITRPIVRRSQNSRASSGRGRGGSGGSGGGGGSGAPLGEPDPRRRERDHAQQQPPVAPAVDVRVAVHALAVADR